MPAVSVLLPVRNAAGTLAECLASLRQQTLADHEVVAVDDGSSDDTVLLLQRAARADPRIRVLRRPAEGLVAALEAGRAAARGAFLARMDGDDVAHPRRLELQVAHLAADPALPLVASRVELLRDPALPADGMAAYVSWSNALVEHDEIRRDLLVESPLVHPSVVLRADVLERLGGWRAGPGPEDYDLWLRVAAAGLRFAKRPEVLLGWRDSPGRLTRVDVRYAPERFRERKLDHLEGGPLASPRPVVVWGAGPVGKGWARALLARGHALAAFVEVDRDKIGQRIHGAPVVGLTAVGGAFPGALHLAAVGQPGARARIRDAAATLGLVDGRDLLAVA